MSANSIPSDSSDRSIPSILFIDHSYHRKTRSTEFLIELLRGMGSVDVEWDDSWLRGNEPVSYRSRVADYDIVVVLQMHQVIADLALTRHRNLIFVPMYDGAFNLPKKFWTALSGVKILCFSAALYEICTRHRLHCELVRYYPERRADIPSPVNGRRLFIWHRRRTPSWSDIASLIPGSQFDRVHLHQVTDPGYEAAARPTAWEMAHIDITESRWFESKSGLDELLNEFNYYLAPRDREGIGQSFLDAMANGLIILSLDYPTANEYIVSGVNGYLLGGDSLDESKGRFDLPETPELREDSLHYMRKGRAIYEHRQSELLRFLGAAGPRKAFSLWSRLLYEIQSRRRQAIVAPTLSRSHNVVPAVSVIVINHNNVVGLSRTINSVFRQDFADFEFIVIDGASTDGSTDFVQAQAAHVDRWLSEPSADAGVAMMKGVQVARGDRLVFLNAGDEFFGNSAVSDALQDVPESADVVYGHHFSRARQPGSQVQLVADMRATIAKLAEGDVSARWLSGIPCGSSTFVRAKWLRSIELDSRHPLAVDHNLLFAIARAGGRFYHSTTFISTHDESRMSKDAFESCNSDRKAIALQFTQDAARVEKFYDQRLALSRRRRRRRRKDESRQSPRS